MELVDRVEHILERGSFDHCRYSGCFDIAAARDFTFFIKVLDNVDSFQETQATNLKIMSQNFSAAIALVGTHTRRENLADSVVYERFDVPTFTPDTLENIIANNVFPQLYRQRGGLFAEINPDKLRSMRASAGLTQRELAEKVGTTKKSIYEHEAGRKKASLDIVEKIEKAIGNVTDHVALEYNYEEKTEAKSRFEGKVANDLKRIGLATDHVYQAPFNILARTENILILSAAEENERRLKRDAKHVADIADVTRRSALAVTEEEISLDIPSVTELQLRDMTMRGLKKRLK